MGGDAAEPANGQPRRRGFRTADLVRALKVLQQAGITVSRLEIETDGKLALTLGDPGPDAEKRAARRALDDLRARLEADSAARRARRSHPAS